MSQLTKLSGDLGDLVDLIQLLNDTNDAQEVIVRVTKATVPLVPHHLRKTIGDALKMQTKSYYEQLIKLLDTSELKEEAFSFALEFLNKADRDVLINDYNFPHYQQ